MCYGRNRSMRPTHEKNHGTVGTLGTRGTPGTRGTLGTAKPPNGFIYNGLGFSPIWNCNNLCYNCNNLYYIVLQTRRA